MIAFTPADHVTEREPGPWRDCTFAGMLETMRLGLPGGDEIPPTEAEKERFRAAAGLPDNHVGATIEDTLPAARTLYGLTPDEYELTRDWTVAERWLRDPSRVLVVTGMLSAVPIGLRHPEWDAFTGPHAVAGRGHPTVPSWCDPRGPKDGAYKGEPVTIATWHRFATSLPGWQAIVMRAQGGAVVITDPTPMVVDLPVGRQLYRADGITPLVKMSVPDKDAYSPDGGPKATQRYVVTRTGGVLQQVVVMIAGLDFRPYQGDTIHTVTVQIDGAETYRTTV